MEERAAQRIADVLGAAVAALKGQVQAQQRPIDQVSALLGQLTPAERVEVGRRCLNSL